VAVDDQLRFAVENVGQPHGSFLAFQNVFRHRNHWQPSSLRGDGVELTSGRLLSDTQRIQFAPPDLLIHNGRQSCGTHG
jgi:hypothetical protein